MCVKLLCVYKFVMVRCCGLSVYYGYFDQNHYLSFAKHNLIMIDKEGVFA